MGFADVVEGLIEDLVQYRGVAVFNQFSKVDPDLDVPGSAGIRCDNLRLYLGKFESAAYVMVGEAAGYAGARFTGIAFTDEYHLVGSHCLPWACKAGYERTSVGKLRRERSSDVVWSALGNRQDVVLWNVFPWHPYDVRQLSNRRPTAAEVRSGLDLLSEFVSLYPGRKIYALGLVAKRALTELGLEVTYVRHPAQGGMAEFIGAVAEMEGGLMRIAEISPVTLEAVPDSEVLVLHLRLHQLWGGLFEGNKRESAGDLTREDLVNAHRFIVAEMTRRVMRHEWTDTGLHRFGEMELGSLVTGAERVMVVPNFVSMVGSTVTHGPALDRDMDVVVRSELRDGKFVIWAENVDLPLRKILDASKAGRLHMIANPQGPHGPSVPLYHLMLVPVADVERRDVFAIKPWYDGPLPKPAMRLYTEFFSIGELWDKWAAKRIERGLAVENKLNGFRVLCEKKGRAVRIRTDGGKDLTDNLPDVVVALGRAEADFAVDCDLGIVQDGIPWPRVKLMTLLSGKPEVPAGAVITVTAFDVLYDGEDVTGFPFSERRAGLERFVEALGALNVRVSQQEIVFDRQGLEKAAERLAGLPGSEGVVVKTLNAPYPLGEATSEWAKVKNVVEIKAVVLEVKPTERGGYNFRGGLLLGDAEYTNVVEFEGQKVVDLGFSFTAPFEAKPGDIVTFRVEEIIPQANGELAWTAANPVDVDETRKRPYYAAQAVDLARRNKVYQEFGRAGLARLAVTLVGTGALGSRGRRGAAVLIEYDGRRVQIDGEKPDDIQGDLDALLVTDVNAWNAEAALEAGGVVGSYSEGGLQITPHGVRHTAHPVYGYLIEADGKRVAYVPELWAWPAWATNLDLAIVDGSAWRRDISFSGGVGGHRALSSLVESAVEHDARWIVATHVGRPTVQAVGHGEEIPGLEVAEDGTRLVLAEKQTQIYTGVIVAFFLPNALAEELTLSAATVVDATFVLFAEELHLTLAYLGENQEEHLELDRLLEAVRLFAAKASPVQASVGGACRFSHVNEDGTQAFSVLLDAPALPCWRQSLVETLASVGMRPKQEHGYIPHVTVAYIPPDSALVVPDFPERAIVFDKLTVAWGDKRFDFALQGGLGRVGLAEELPGEGDTRAERAAAFWAAHWYESYPATGRGEFVYHHHWRGLSADEATLDERALLETENSVHGDLRLAFTTEALWGFTVFLGRAEAVKERDLAGLPADDALEGVFKLHQPVGWLDVARRAPLVVEPGGIGSASRSWSKFFEVDRGTYEIGVWREHSFEVILHGSKIKGRYLISFVPVEGGKRIWTIRRPADQTPIAQRKDLEAVARDVKKSGQRWLVWAKPGEKPRLVDVKEIGTVEAPAES